MNTTRAERIGRIAGIPLAYLALAIALTWPATETFTTRLAGDYGDGFQNLWNYWWVKEALTHFKNPFFTDHLRYPQGVTLVFQTMVWPDAVVALPLWLVLPPLGVYNAVVLWSFVLTGLGMYALVKDFTGNRAVAFFAGAVFMAVPFHMGHALGHQHLVELGYLPLYLMFLHRIVKGGTLRDAVLGGLCLAAAALCSWYQLLFAFFWSLGVFGWALATHQRELVSVAFAKRALALAAAFLVPCGPVLLAMYLKARGEPIVGAHDPSRFSADLESFFYPGGRMVWASLSPRFMRWSGNFSENGNYLGYVLLALGLVGVWRSSLARAYAVTGVIGALLSMGPAFHDRGLVSHEGSMPYAYLVRLFPGLDFSGVPVRFGLLAQGSLVIMAALGLAALLRERRAVLSWGAAGAVTTLALVELWPMLLPTSVWPVPPPLLSWAKSGEHFSVLDLTGDTRMLWHAIFHGQPCLGGYVTRTPKSLADWWEEHPVLGAIDRPPANFTPRVSGEEPAIEHRWGLGSPDPRVMNDFFRGEWQGEIEAPAEGDFTFYVLADDGAGVTVDGKTVVPPVSHFIAAWRPGRIHLTAGRHALTVTYLELTGMAELHVGWEGPGVPQQLLRPAPTADGRPGTFHVTYSDARVETGLGRERGQAMLRELGTRYVILGADDRGRMSLFEGDLGLTPVWEGAGLRILELPGASIPKG